MTVGKYSPSRFTIKSDVETDIGDYDGGNYAKFATDGEVGMVGTARAWRTVALKPSNVGKPSANPPAAGEYQGFAFDRFDRATEEQVYYIWRVPSDFAAGDNSVRGHFGFIVDHPPAPATADEAVVLGFEYKKMSPGDTFNFAAGTASGTITEVIAQGETARIWHETDTGLCTTTGWTVDDVILFRFYRDATNPADTYDNEAVATDNDAWVAVFHLEYLIDKLGEAS